MLANGVDVKTVQTRLGHANASITLGWYAHAISEKDHEAADLLGSLLAANQAEGSADASASENSAEAPAEGVETEDEKMSPFCLQREQSETQRKQASELKLVS